MPLPLIPLITAITPLLGRMFDKDKPLGKTNAATAGGVTLGGAALMLIQTGEPNMMIAGYVLGAVSAALALYKEKEK